MGTLSYCLCSKCCCIMLKGDNMKNKQMILKLSEKYNSFYLYDGQIVQNSIDNLKNSFEDVQFLYSAKTNPHREIVKKVVENGFGIDAASFGEVLLAQANGLDADKIYYSTPGKTQQDIAGAVDKAVIIADSFNEIKMIDEIAAEKGIKLQIGVRINPDFTFDADKGASAKYGIDEEAFFAHKDWIKSLENTEIIGIHVHSKSQELRGDVIAAYHRKMFALCKKVEQQLDIKLKFVNLGSGIGIPFAAEDIPVDVAKLGAETSQAIKQFKAEMGDIKVLIETGRYVCGKSGIYATKVLDKKYSRGITFVILSSTLNGFVRPSLAAMVEGYAQGIPAANEPFYTKPNAFGYTVIKKGDETAETETVTLCGNLCTAADLVEKSITLPKLEIGDIITMDNAGCYAAVMTPFQFSSHIPPREIFIKENGEIIE